MFLTKALLGVEEDVTEKEGTKATDVIAAIIRGVQKGMAERARRSMCALVQHYVGMMQEIDELEEEERRRGEEYDVFGDEGAEGREGGQGDA